jgi:[acyl-carrier-protein] S-malonyltransferase
MWFGMTESGCTAFAFPGMGTRLTGFERALFFRHRTLMLPFLEQASHAASMDLVSWLEHDAFEEQYLDDRKSQIFTFAFSAALYEVLKDHGVAAQFMAGYSFGHYAALFASNCLSFSDALACAYRAFDFMRESLPEGAWGMAAIVGLSIAEIEGLLDGSIMVVNVNGDSCAILAGFASELETLRGRAMEKGALKAELLPVAIPYHLPGILAPAAERLRQYLGTLSWHAPVVPIISSIDQSLITDVGRIIDFTIEHLCTPIHWLRTVGSLTTLGVTRIVECGPGVSISRYGSFMPFDISYVNVKTIRRNYSL